jgi:hypothetical protein
VCVRSLKKCTEGYNVNDPKKHLAFFTLWCIIINGGNHYDSGMIVMMSHGNKKSVFLLFLCAVIVLVLLLSCATAPKKKDKGSTSDSGSSTGTSSTDSGTTAFGQSRKSRTSSYDDYTFTGDLFFGKGLASAKRLQSIKPEEGIIFIIFYGALFSALYIVFIIRKIIAKRKRFS